MDKFCVYCDTIVTIKDRIPKTVVYICSNCKQPLSENDLITKQQK